MNAPAPAAVPPTDAEDQALFRSLGLGEREVERLISIKHNDRSGRRLGRIPIRAGENGDVRAVKRAGQIVGQAKYLKSLQLNVYVDDRPALTEFCAELQSNRSIETLSLLLENPNVDVSPLVPFLRENATVTNLVFWNCSLQSAVELSNAVLERGKDALRSLHIYNSPLGDVELNQRLALRNLTHLSLDGCGIGKRACASLASLLEDPQSKLWGLYLENNSIGDEAVSVLVNSLLGNTKLEELDLVGNNEISRDGWSRLLDLVCNNEDVAKSNHGLCYLRIFNVSGANVPSIPVNDANLLRASLEINREGRWEEKHVIIKRKMIWRHTRGDLNIGEKRAIDVRLLPRILAWFADRSNGSLIQYHNPPLSEAETSAIRLDSLHRIFRERPEMFETKSGIGSKSDVHCIRAKKRKLVPASRRRAKTG